MQICRVLSKNVTCPVTCPMCDTYEKYECHLYFGCRYADEVWLVAGLW